MKKEHKLSNTSEKLAGDKKGMKQSDKKRNIQDTNKNSYRSDYSKGNKKREIYEDAEAFEDFNDFVKATGWKKSGNQPASKGKSTIPGRTKSSPAYAQKMAASGAKSRSASTSDSKSATRRKEHPLSNSITSKGKNRSNEKLNQEKPFVTSEGRSKGACSYQRSCGGCDIQREGYGKHLEDKQKEVEKLIKKYCKVEPILGMKQPKNYRHKVHVVFDHDRKGNPFSGVYEEGTHRVIAIERCLIHNEKADAIIATIRGMLKSFKILTYDEDSGYGLLRHVLIRTGYHTGEIMVVLVLASPIMPSKNNFVKALRKEHPEVTTVVVNVNDKQTSMVLGDKEQVIYGKGYIEDKLCGMTFRISPKSFYQVNPAQTEVLYQKAIELAELTGKETVIDAYCGTGTIGLIASKHADKVIGVELNKDAVRDAVVNAKRNEATNIEFYNNDAGAFLSQMAAKGESADVVFMDPPRTGSTPQFLDAVAVLKPKRIVYVSCNPVTLERDLEYLTKKGYKAQLAIPVDMFPWTKHVETVVLMSRKDK